MSPLRPVAILIATLMLAPPGLTLNPLDDDAGSGRDAGDGPEAAVAIGFGSYKGRLTRFVDQEDWYALELEAGTHLEVDWASKSDERPLRLHLYGPGPQADTPSTASSDWFGKLFHTIPHSGTWYLTFSGPWPGATDYSFDVTGRAHPTLFTHREEGAALVTEATFDRADEVYFSFRQKLEEHSSERPGFMASLVEFRFERTDDSWGRGSSTLLLASKSGVPPRIETAGVLPPIEMPMTINNETGHDWHQLNVLFTNVSGWVRIYTMSGHSKTWTETVLSSTGPLNATHARGSIETWTSLDVADGDDVILPGYTRTDGGTYETYVDRPYFGYFVPRGNPGRIVAPNGTECQTCPFGDLLIHPEHGRWTIELDETERLAPISGELYYIGARYPDLGMTPRDGPRVVAVHGLG